MSLEASVSLAAGSLAAQETLSLVTATVQSETEDAATGLEVAESADNPAFFLVGALLSDAVVEAQATADNLELAIGDLATEQTGFAFADDLAAQALSIANLAQLGIANDELNFAFENTVAAFADVLEAAGVDASVTSDLTAQLGAVDIEAIPTAIDTLSAEDLAAFFQGQLTAISDTVAALGTASAISGFEQLSLEQEQDFLNDLAGSLQLGAAALVEDDLALTSVELAQSQAQQELAILALTQANENIAATGGLIASI